MILLQMPKVAQVQDWLICIHSIVNFQVGRHSRWHLSSMHWVLGISGVIADNVEVKLSLPMWIVLIILFFLFAFCFSICLISHRFILLFQRCHQVLRSFFLCSLPVGHHRYRFPESSKWLQFWISRVIGRRIECISSLHLKMKIKRFILWVHFVEVCDRIV